MLYKERDVRHEHGFERIKWTRRSVGRLVDASQEPISDPIHNRFEYGFLAGEVPEERPLGDAHLLGNRRRRDVTGVLVGRQFQDSLNRNCAPLISREVFWLHGFQFR